MSDLKIAIKYSLCILFLVFPISFINAQDHIDSNDLKISALPYYTYGKGLGVTSPDSLFKLNIRFRMQNRATATFNDGEDEAYEMLIRRLRLRFDGFVGDPRFLYVIQLSFAPYDVGLLHEDESLNVIRDAIFFYRPNTNWTIGFGQTKLPGNRQRLNSSGALQLTDRSINNSKFNIDRDYGLQVFYNGGLKAALPFALKGAISTGDGRNYVKAPDNGLAYTGKLELYPFGEFEKSGAYFEGDLIREQNPKLMLSGVYHYNNKARRMYGQRGLEFFNKEDLTSIFADAIFKYQGVAFNFAYMNRAADTPVKLSESGYGIYYFTGEGYDFQTSYINRKDLEFIARYSTQYVDDKIKYYVNDAVQYSLGVTKYLREHAFKLQAEVTYDVKDQNLFNQNFGGNKHIKNWYFRLQIEMGI